MTFQIKPRKTFSDDNNNNIKQFYIILVYLIQSKPERKKNPKSHVLRDFSFIIMIIIMIILLHLETVALN